MKPNALRLSVSRIPGETSNNHTWRQSLVNGTIDHRKVTPDKLLADLLKREAKAVMGAITECGADQIPAHLGRLSFLRELINHAIRHELIPGDETRLSGVQLLFCNTVADHLAALEITKKTHRAPQVLTARDTELEKINRKLDWLAGLFAKCPAIDEILNSEIDADLIVGAL